jgi:hypothetical protein
MLPPKQTLPWPTEFLQQPKEVSNRRFAGQNLRGIERSGTMGLHGVSSSRFLLSTAIDSIVRTVSTSGARGTQAGSDPVRA